MYDFEHKFLNALKSVPEKELENFYYQQEPYQVVAEQLPEVYREISSKLGAEHRGLISEFESLKNRELKTEMDLAYHKGFRDCLRLMKMLR